MRPLTLPLAFNRTTAGLYGLAGGLLGAALASPLLAACAWLSIAAYTVALGRTRSSFAAAASVVVAHGLTCMIAFPWMWAGNFLLFDYSLTGMVALRFGEAMILAVPYAIALGVGHGLFGRWLAARFWLPLAWVGGELLSYATSNACVDDWLNTQWTVQPVLRALALVGWWPLLLACLFASASFGEALASRRWRVALPGVAIIAALSLAPPIVDDKAAALEGVAAMHTSSTVALPHVLPDGVDLLLWPEATLELRPLLAEGPGNGAFLPPLLPGSPVTHLTGLLTTLPGGILQNQAVAVAADGRVLASRAKRVFLPVAERRFLGVGQTPYLPGTRPALLEVGDRAIVPLICGENLSRGLLAEGVAAGGELFAILASDRWFASERALQQFLAIQVLRSVEFGVPSVRAAFDGRASFVGADGRVLARSALDRNGILAWDRERGARDFDFRSREIDDRPPPTDPPPDVAVLYSEQAPHLRARCPEGRCAYYPLEVFECGDSRAEAVIVAGHGKPPEYLARPAAEIAAAIRCFDPELVIIDTCFGASSELLLALGDLEAVIVATTSLLPSSGFNYGPDFFTATDPAARADAVQTFPATELLRWRNDPGALAEVLARVAAMSAGELGAHLARRVPPTVKVELPGGGPLLVPIAWERLGTKRPRPAVRPRSRLDRGGM
jgi:predicted amidohydrolase